jgi:hypothetical protein
MDAQKGETGVANSAPADEAGPSLTELFAQFGHLPTGLCLLQRTDDLFFATPRLLHWNLSPPNRR